MEDNKKIKSFKEHSEEKLDISDVRTRFLILSGEGSSDTENQFVMELNTEDEAIEHFKEFKEGTFKNAELMIYKAVLIKEG